MGRFAQLRLFCDNCGQETNAFVEDGASHAKVKCEHCQNVFDFVAGMMYEPVGYVTEIPSWARIDDGTDKPEPNDPAIPPQRDELIHQARHADDPMPPPLPPPGTYSPVESSAVSAGLKAWCIFNLITCGFSLVTILLIALGNIPIHMPPTTMVMSLGSTIAAIMAMVLILRARKVGLYLQITLTVVGLMMQLAQGNHYGLFSFFGLLGPLITWLLMRRNWHMFT